MDIFSTIIGFGMTVASTIVQVALAILVLYIIAKVTWFIVSNAWQVIHQKSHDKAVVRFKNGIRRPKVKPPKLPEKLKKDDK